LAVLVSNCGGNGDPNQRLDTGLKIASEAITGSSSFDLPDFPSVVRVCSSTSCCTGSAVGPNHILTAGHCFNRNIDTVTATISGSGLNATRTSVTVTPFLRNDGELLVTSSPLGLEPLRVLTEPMNDSWVGRHILSVGYAGSTTRRAGWQTITAVRAKDYDLGNNTDNVSTEHGDSGGPDLAFIDGHWYIVGTHSNVNNSTRVDSYTDWLRSLIPQTGAHVHSRRSTNDLVRQGDVNHDGRADFLVTTPTETKLYLANSTGTGFTQPWQGPASWTLGNVELALGDFDGDHKADLVALTTTAMSVFLSTGTGFSSTPFFTAPGWQVGYVNLHVANFNGDSQGLSDILLVTVNGSTMYTSTGSGFLFDTWGDSHSLYNSTATVADFDGDGKSDVIFQTDEGAQLLTGADSNGAAILNSFSPIVDDAGSNNWARGSVHLTAGRFASLMGSDLIVSGGTGVGSSLYTLGAGPTFTRANWVRTDLLANENNFIVGDFSDCTSSCSSISAGLDDVLIQTRGGSFLYVATGRTDSPFQPNVWTRGSLTLLNTSYVAGDWSGDGKSDIWIVNPGGTFGYSGNASGGFTANVWTLPSLKYQTFVVQ
jgi:hypothetical protein